MTSSAQAPSQDFPQRTIAYAAVIEAAAKLADWFIPESLRLETETRRRALMFLVSHLLGPWLGFVVVGYLSFVDPKAGIELWIAGSAIAAFLLFPFVLRGIGRLNLLALISVQNVAFIVLYLSYFYGGMSSPFLPWLIIVPMLAFFYLGEDKRLRNIALAGFVADIVIFYAVLDTTAAMPSRLTHARLSTVGLVSLLCAGLYVTMMAFYYARIVRSNSELEREVQRHKQTAVMLVAARDAAEAASRAKTEFLATMSHELRTPLNAVIGFSDIMANELLGPLGNENYRDYSRDILDSATHLLQIINDILDISKAEARSAELEEGFLDCQSLINSTCRLLRPRLDKAKLSLEMRLPKNLPQLRADSRMCKQMLLNLLTNAIKFSLPGGLIEIEATADSRRGLAIAIRDSGIGISERDLLRIRKPFEQVDTALNRRNEGTGLGLPLVDMMIAQHGGRLELESVEGKGTTARLVFPVERLIWLGQHDIDADTESDAASAINTPEGDPSDDGNARRAPRILVVEDDQDFRDLLERMLRRRGFGTVAARNGREALRHLEKQPIDLVITDMVMPEMDGVELMRILQRKKPNLPIIGLSGADDYLEYRRIATHLGARRALQKPVSQTDLIRAVNDVLAA